LASHASR